MDLFLCQEKGNNRWTNVGLKACRKDLEPVAENRAGRIKNLQSTEILRKFRDRTSDTFL